MARLAARERAVLAVGGAMYALFAAFGHQAECQGHSDPARALLTAALLLPVTAGALWLLLRRPAREAPAEGRPFRARRAFGAILACYVPMFLICYPGSFAYDVPFQLEQAFTGQYSTHHPLLHTLLLGACVRLGHAMGWINLGAALYTALQMTALAACFAACCASIARQSGARAARWSAVFFALYPLHMCMAVNATKDVLFSGLFALTLALSREWLIAGALPRGRAAGLVLAATGALLLRNNALYAVAAFAVALLILCRGRGLRLFGALALSMTLCVAGNAAMRAATRAEPGDLRERLSWPIQQMARARNLCGDRLTPQEKAAVDALMPGESWRLYDPTISDPVKFEFDTAELLRAPGTYLGAYLSIGAKCPGVYFDALLMHTYSFFYPYRAYGVSGYYLQMGVSDRYYDWCDFERIADESLLPRVRASLAWRFGAKGAMQIPVVGWLFNMGVIVWAMLFFVLREAYAGRWASFAASLLPVMLWGTFLLGPVMAGRYIYPFVCCLPVLAARVRRRTDVRVPGANRYQEEERSK